MADTFSDATIEELFPTSQDAGTTVEPREVSQPPIESSPGAAINAELRQMLESGKDPREVYPQEQGFFAKSDVFGPETEESFSPRVREFVRRFYGPAEMQHVPDDRTLLETKFGIDPGIVGLPRGGLSALWTRMFGSPATEDEQRQIRQATALRERGAMSADARYKRMMEEVYRGAPSAADVRGDVPEDIPPWLREYAGEKRFIELPKFQAEVLLRDYGISQGTKKDQEVIKRGRAASVSVNQLESITPGLAKNTLGPLLAADFNVHYGLTGTDKEVTSESLALRQIDWQGSRLLVYTHPETGKPTLFDPVKLELADLAEILPELMVIGGDIAGMIMGTSIGATLGPKGAVAGNLVGGAFGAFYGRIKSISMALEKNGFKFDERYNGFTKEGFNDENGNPFVASRSDIYLKAMPDALFSVGGNLIVRGVLKLGRLALFGTAGADAIKGGLTEEQFLKAIDNFRGTDIARAAARTGGPWGQGAPTSVALQKEGETLIEKSRVGGLPAEESTAMFELAQKFLRQAEVLRSAEAGTTAESGRAIIKEQLTREAEGEAAVTTRGAIEADPADVARAVEKGLPVTAEREVGQQIDVIIEQNRASLDNLDNMFAGTGAASADELGEAFALKSKAIMGDPIKGTTGIYGILRRIETALETRGRPVPYKPFDIAPMRVLVNKLQQASGAVGGAFPRRFLENWNAATAKTSFGAKGEVINRGRLVTAKGEKEGTLNVSFKQINDMLKSARATLADANLSQPQVAGLSELMKKLEQIQVRGLQIIDDAGAAAGTPTSYAKQMESANIQIRKLPEIWQRGLTKGLGEGTYAKLAKRLFEKNASPEQVGNIMGTLRPGKNQLKMMRNTLLYRYKQAMKGLTRGEVEAGADVAGRRVRIGMATDDLTITKADQAVHGRFMDENKTWIDALFKRGEFDRISDEITTIANQQREAKRVISFDDQLRKNPIFEGRMIEIRDDLGEVAVLAPQRLLDEIYGLPPGPRAAAFDKLFDAFKGLPKIEREMAEENVRGLLFRKLMRPGELMAATRDEPFSAYGLGKRASAELKANSDIYDKVFGEAHRKNLEKIFKDVSTVSAETGAEAAETLFQKGRTQIPMAMLKVYVGVLNRKARSLNQAQKVLGERLSRKFAEALLNPEKAASLVRGRNISLKSKLLAARLGSILGIEIGEAFDAVNTFGIDFENQFPGIPKSDPVTEALGGRVI